MKQVYLIWTVFYVLFGVTSARTIGITTPDTICSHVLNLDENGTILAWYRPDTPGAGYDHVVRLASEFIKSGTPVDPGTGLPLYFISCCFQGPHIRGQEDFDSGKTWENWMHNPACVFAGLVQSLVLDYRVYSGDAAYIDVVKKMLDFQLQHGTTPADWPWPNVPYASSDPGEIIYRGATKWEHEGMRGDGLHGIEPDKIGELGIAYLKFYEVTEDNTYIEAAVNCADALAKHVREIPGDLKSFSGTEIRKSPWPFRINARTGVVIDDYCSNVIEPIRLFDELVRIKQRINLSEVKAAAYQKARNIAWTWLYSKSGPMKTYIWNAYFEDIPNDPERSNRVQITSMETARYLLKNPVLDPDIDVNVPALIHWVASVFGTEGMDAIREQTWCYEPMGSHTSRYASVCALYYERTGDIKYKEQAYRFFNFATYMTYDNGVVAVGPKWPGSWFSDGYGDYIRHFMEGLAAIPEWAPADEDHFLRSSSVVQTIDYTPKRISYRTFEKSAVDVLRLTAKPDNVKVNGSVLNEVKDNIERQGWTWEKLNKGGVLRVRHDMGADVVINK
ncbi:hypothetical protein JXQ31_08470 [candidate division KSB1 bacterium]|nr:hypothetical protein [candidate division KSB1 bacterium]